MERKTLARIPSTMRLPRFLGELLGEAVRSKGDSLVHRAILHPAFVLTLTVVVSTPAQSPHVSMPYFTHGIVSGVVQDTDGVPQMGALVEVMLPSSRVVASVFTDVQGRYQFPLNAGRYRVRASAALLLPAIREKLQVDSGAKTVVNLTLSTILSPSSWLPASRKALAEPGDDWMWTLRSSPSRSILRLAAQNGEGESDEAEGLSVSSSRQERTRNTAGGRVVLKNSDGGFARGGSHTILSFSAAGASGAGSVLRGDFSGPRSPYPVSPSAEISLGLQRHTILNGVSRAVVTYSSHPELVGNNGAAGMQGITVRSAQRIELGELLRVDVGSVLRDSFMGGNAFLVEPFLQVSARPGSDLVLTYTMTQSRDTASVDDLDRVQPALPIAVRHNGRFSLESGSHHALSVRGRAGSGTAEVTLYHNDLRSPQVAGVGVFTASELHQDGIVADPTTHTYRLAAPNYSSSGVRVGLQHPLTNKLQFIAEIETGETLRGAPQQQRSTTEAYRRSLRPVSSYAANIAIDGTLPKSSAQVRASYRFQPHHALTALDAFNADGGAFLSCSVRQPLSGLHFLPRGMEAVLDVQNLLAQGYEPLVSNDGQTLYLAQTSRVVQAGVSFTF